MSSSWLLKMAVLGSCSAALYGCGGSDSSAPADGDEMIESPGPGPSVSSSTGGGTSSLVMPPTGGAANTGGGGSGGGIASTGGSPPVGGSPATGGSPAAGGSTATGGSPGTGGGAGAGSERDQCIDGVLAGGDGEACAECLCDNCFNQLVDCYSPTDATRFQLCSAVIDCCAGLGLSGDACYFGGCQAQIDAAAGGTAATGACTMPGNACYAATQFGLCYNSAGCMCP
jgi:hypothetical protein